jgi:hypothetical protein
MGPTPNLFFSQRGKPALHLVKPRSGCRSEMCVAGVTADPSDGLGQLLLLLAIRDREHCAADRAAGGRVRAPRGIGRHRAAHRSTVVAGQWRARDRIDVVRAALLVAANRAAVACRPCRPADLYSPRGSRCRCASGSLCSGCAAHGARQAAQLSVSLFVATNY